ncbi:hypothetical protein AOLI_G00298980 [Acnodon oligacanthus]
MARERCQVEGSQPGCVSTGQHGKRSAFPTLFSWISALGTPAEAATTPRLTLPHICLISTITVMIITAIISRHSTACTPSAAAGERI